MRYLSVFSVVVMVCSVAWGAGTMSVDIVEVDNSSGGSELDGFRTFDLIMTTDVDWVSTLVRLVPDQPGSIYQHAMGGEVTPNPNGYDLFPALEFDTYFMHDQWSTNGYGLAPPGLDPVVFDDNEIELIMFNADFDDIGTFPLVRITIAANATGWWQLEAYNATDAAAKVVFNGALYAANQLPEPGTLSLLAVGAIGLLKRRRR